MLSTIHLSYSTKNGYWVLYNDYGENFCKFVNEEDEIFPWFFVVFMMNALHSVGVSPYRFPKLLKGWEPF